ncbi:MAG: glycosyltransferase family 2 protein [Candidatus Altiarchaeota archaeon]|nr:glycosyltransferase family 2 protein [Candidatus Altiarchaeota archaeon]
MAPGPFSLFKRSALLEVGGFDEKSVAEDLEIVFRLRKRGHSIRMSPRAYVYTEIPHRLRDFIIQRRRWRAGFLDAVQKHPTSLTPQSEFGRQNIMNSVYIVITLILFVLIGRAVYRFIKPILEVITYVGFHPWIYLKDLKFTFDFLGMDVQMLIYTIFMISLTALFIYLASKFHGLKPNLLDGALFVSIYGFAVTTATLLAIYSWVKGDYSW